MPLVTKKVLHNRRMGFLPKYFGASTFLSIEQRLYAYADKAIPDYTGGLWIYMDAEIDGRKIGFLVPPYDSDTVELQRLDGGGSNTMTKEAAGLALTTMAVNHELWRQSDSGNEKAAIALHETWATLTNACYAHPDAPQIAAFLD